MIKEFIPYEQALKLKELGFNEPCLGYYVTVEVPNPFLVTTKIFDTQGGYFTFAPTFSQAFRWFRDKHNLIGSVCEDVDGNFSLWTNKGNLLLQGKEYKEFTTYEEAELACLNKLIEIVKND